MKKNRKRIWLLILTVSLFGCTSGSETEPAGLRNSRGSQGAAGETAESNPQSDQIPSEKRTEPNGPDLLGSEEAETIGQDEEENETENAEMKIKITVGDTELFANMEDNVTTRAILEQMPMTLPMTDLYNREMCYRYGAYALPTDTLRSDGYETGDIVYWAPGGSFVILYAQNGEHFERAQLGHIESGVEIFEKTGDCDVTFEVVPDGEE